MTHQAWAQDFRDKHNLSPTEIHMVLAFVTLSNSTRGYLIQEISFKFWSSSLASTAFHLSWHSITSPAFALTFARAFSGSDLSYQAKPAMWYGSKIPVAGAVAQGTPAIAQTNNTTVCLSWNVHASRRIISCANMCSRVTQQAKCTPRDFFLIFYHKVKRNLTASDVSEGTDIKESLGK